MCQHSVPDGVDTGTEKCTDRYVQKSVPTGIEKCTDQYRKVCTSQMSDVRCVMPDGVPDSVPNSVPNSVPPGGVPNSVPVRCH